MKAFELREVTRRFGRAVALQDVSVGVQGPSIVGLIGRNGSGKTTLLRTISGMYLPDEGTCTTLGSPTPRLGAPELSRIGVVHQHERPLEWMRVRQLLRYVAAFYPDWDAALERQLVQLFELDMDARVGALSPGNAQKLNLVLATAHRPELLLLDEPLSDLDPLSRRDVLEMLLDRFRNAAMTIVISSHLLDDVERIVDRIVCLHEGRVVEDAELDTLKERYEEWIVASPEGRLPARFGEPFILHAEGDAHRARLLVRDAHLLRGPFELEHGATVESRALTLDRIFPVLAGRVGASRDFPAGSATPRLQTTSGGLR